CATNMRSAFFCSARYGLLGSWASRCLSRATSVIVPPTVSTSAVYKSVLIVIVCPAADGAASPGTGAGEEGAPDGGAGACDGSSLDLGALFTGGGAGACSFCQASHRNSAEKAKIRKRIRRCVSMRA